MKRWAFLALGLVACAGRVVVGDDTPAADPTDGNAQLFLPDAYAEPDGDFGDGGSPPPVTVPSPPDSGEVDSSCPQLSPPAPDACDGAVIQPVFDASGCVTGYVCAQ